MENYEIDKWFNENKEQIKEFMLKKANEKREERKREFPMFNDEIDEMMVSASPNDFKKLDNIFNIAQSLYDALDQVYEIEKQIIEEEVNASHFYDEDSDWDKALAYNPGLKDSSLGESIAELKKRMKDEYSKKIDY